MIRTIIPRQTDAYASFPTVIQHSDRLHLFYRQGVRGENTPHGKKGRVLSIDWNTQDFLRQFETDGDLFASGDKAEVFAEHNEMDAIVSDMGELGYTLSTRNYDKNKTMRTFMSFSDQDKGPIFTNRTEVVLPQLDWLAFYGQGFAYKNRRIFTAYGSLKGEIHGRPLILAHDKRGWELLAYLPSKFNGIILNESALIRQDREFHLFMRQDTGEFGIWKSISPDLKNWSRPIRLFKSAHAPMTIHHKDTVWLSYRKILAEDHGAICIQRPLEAEPEQQLDTYQGSVYDGGYSAPIVLNNQLFVFYYFGNREREPFIKAVRV